MYIHFKRFFSQVLTCHFYISVINTGRRDGKLDRTRPLSVYKKLGGAAENCLLRTKFDRDNYIRVNAHTQLLLIRRTLTSESGSRDRLVWRVASLVPRPRPQRGKGSGDY